MQSRLSSGSIANIIHSRLDRSTVEPEELYTSEQTQIGSIALARHDGGLPRSILRTHAVRERDRFGAL